MISILGSGLRPWLDVTLHVCHVFRFVARSAFEKRLIVIFEAEGVRGGRPPNPSVCRSDFVSGYLIE